MAEGVHQPFEISTITGLDYELIDLQMSAFPNPTTDFLKLQINQIGFTEAKKFEYQLYDMNGKILEHKKLTKNKTEINMSNYPSGGFILKVISEDQTVETFKIIKY